MDIFDAIEIEKVVTIIFIACLIIGAIFLGISGIGLILHVRLVWAMIATIVSFVGAAIAALINALLNFLY